MAKASFVETIDKAKNKADKAISNVSKKATEYAGMASDYTNDKMKEVLNAGKKGFVVAQGYAEDTAKNVKDLIEEKTPEVIEKASEMIDKAREAADVTLVNADQALKKAEIWIKTKKEAEKLRKFNYDTDTLMPIFDDTKPEDYSVYPVINIVDTDEKRSKSEACEGSIGFKTEAKDVPILNIYTNSFNLFPISLDDEVKEGVYYVNPYVSNEYIESSRYALYLKQERVRELVNVADSLGAKKVSVAFTTKEKNMNDTNGKMNLKVGKNKLQAEAEQRLKESLKLSVVESQMYEGHNNPVRPKLVYYKNDKALNEMIEKRISGTNHLLKHTYSIAYATSSSAKMKEAVKIDGALKSLKLGASESLTVCSEVESELVLSYTIEF